VEGLFFWLHRWDSAIATWVACCLQPLAIYILLSGLDDLLLDLVWLSRFRRPAPPEPAEGPRRPIALMIPCWREQDVIASMIEHNRAAIHYDNYEVFAGAYRNDEATQNAIRKVAARDARVHLALVPHDGPTVKADCLNWIYQEVLEYEESSGTHFDLVVLHDAEDLIHPGEFSTIDRYADHYDFIQVPVLPLPTPLREFTHGVYCDDFAESQGKDLESRQQLGGFLPGCGVGTGWRREALDELARLNSNRLFAPDHLTEDYENGLRLHALGYRQILVPLRQANGSWRATREYFPRAWRPAVRQRSRWVTGGALQTWEKWGWRGNRARRYFFWRDRKGLWGNPISLLCNLILLYGFASCAASWAGGYRWPLVDHARASLLMHTLLWINFGLLVERTLVRTVTVARFYGWAFAIGVPLRMLWGNLLNFAATRKALFTYFRARWRGEPLVWIKTPHSYPNREGLHDYRRRLEDILVASDYLDSAALEAAQVRKPEAVDLGDFLVSEGLIGSQELSEAISLQQGLPCVDVRPEDVTPAVARILPRDFARAWRVLPFRLNAGGLDVASPDPPGEQVQAELRQFTRLEIRFHLVTGERFEELASRLL